MIDKNKKKRHKIGLSWPLGIARDFPANLLLLLFVVSIYTLSDLGYSSNLIGSLSRANAALFTRYRVDNALSHKT